MSRRGRRAARLTTRLPVGLPTGLPIGLVAGLLVGALGACGGEERETALAVTVDTTSSGVVRVRSRGDIPRWHLEEVLTVDGFGEVTGMAVDRIGSLWVADGEAREIRVLGPEGRLIRLIGPVGAGAGELGSLRSMAFLGNSVLALDAENGRIVEISRGGAWLDERPWSGEGGSAGDGGVTNRLYPLGPGEVYERSIRDGEEGEERVWVRHGLRGVVGVRPWYEPPESALPEASPPDAVVCEDPSTGGAREFALPFQPRRVQHPVRGGLLAVAWTGEYRVALLDAREDTVLVLEREADAVPLTDARWEEEMAELRRFREENPGVSCDPDDPERPASKPPIRDLRVDAAGRIWVEAHTPDGTQWHVYDSGAHPLGIVPPFGGGGTGVTYIDSEHVAWATRDERGERVTLARIVR